MNKENDELTEIEQSMFESLAKEESPPKFLKEKIIKNMKTNNLIVPAKDKTKIGFLRMSLAFAGAITLLVIGISIGTVFFSGSTNTASLREKVENNNLNDYILLLRASAEKPSESSPEVVRQRIREYTAWAKKTAEKGHLLAGEKLQNKSTILSNTGGEMKIVEESSDRQNNSVEGYFVLRAEDYEQAVEITKDCPHLKYGGLIELKQIDK